MSKSRWCAAAPGIGATLLFLSSALAEPTAERPGARNLSEAKFGPIAGLPTCV